MRKLFSAFETVVVLLLFLTPAFAKNPPSLPARQEAAPVVSDLTYWNNKDFATVSVTFDRQIPCTTYALENPFRVVIDPADTVYLSQDLQLPDEIKPADGIVEKISLVKGSSPLAVDFIVVELKEKVKWRVASKNKNQLVVEFGSQRPKKEMATGVKAKPQTLLASKSDEPSFSEIVDAKCENSAACGTVDIVSSKPIKFTFYETGEHRDVIIDPLEPVYTKIDGLEISQGLFKNAKFVGGVAPAGVKVPAGYYSLDYLRLEFNEPAKTDVAQKNNTISINARPNILPEPVKQPKSVESTKTPEPSPAAQAKPIFLLDIDCKNAKKAATLSLITSGQAAFVTYALPNPPRIFIDALEPMPTDLQKEFVFPDGIVEKISLVSSGGPAPTATSHYNVDFLQVYLREPMECRAMQSRNELEIEIGKVEGAFGIAAAQPQKRRSAEKRKEESQNLGSAEQRKEEAQKKEEKIYAEGFVTQGRSLEECIEVAMANHRPAQIALEEVKLSKMKLDEARRELLPKPKLKYTKTEGKTMDVRFSERRYGVEVTQPIYYSGRLWNTYKQAKLNYEVSQRKFEKVRADLAAKVAESYYALMSAYASLGLQEDLYKEAQEIFDKSKRIYDADLVTQIEFLNVQSQRDQVAYQVESAKRDLDLARLKFQTALSLDPEDIIEVPSELEFPASPSGGKAVDIDVDEALQVAESSRPEVLINTLMVRVNELEQKIAKAKAGFKVDLTAFTGRSGSAYVGETLKMDADHYVGIQAQRTFWGSTLAYTFSKDKTAPRLGQTTRTQSKTDNLEFGLFDYMQGRSEVQAAKVGYEKALNDLFEIQQTIKVDVKEAYYNCEKALTQIRNTENKIRLREKEVQVTTLQTGLGEVPLSQLMESKIKLVDDRVLLSQTLANYYTAIANLNKAIGIVGYYGG